MKPCPSPVCLLAILALGLVSPGWAEELLRDNEANRPAPLKPGDTGERSSAPALREEARAGKVQSRTTETLRSGGIENATVRVDAEGKKVQVEVRQSDLPAALGRIDGVRTAEGAGFTFEISVAPAAGEKARVVAQAAPGEVMVANLSNHRGAAAVVETALARAEVKPGMMTATIHTAPGGGLAVDVQAAKAVEPRLMATVMKELQSGLPHVDPGVPHEITFRGPDARPSTARTEPTSVSPEVARWSDGALAPMGAERYAAFQAAVADNGGAQIFSRMSRADFVKGTNGAADAALVKRGLALLAAKDPETLKQVAGAVDHIIVSRSAMVPQAITFDVPGAGPNDPPVQVNAVILPSAHINGVRPAQPVRGGETAVTRTAITLAHEGRHAWQSGQPRFTKLQGFERNVRMEADAYAFCARVMDRLGYEKEDVAAQTWLATKAETDPRVQRFITGDATPEEQSQVLAQMYRDIPAR